MAQAIRSNDQEGAGVKQIELSAGTIEYQDTGGDGPVLVLLHGLLMDASLWDGPIGDLSADHRCVAPTLPLGAHRHPMRTGADLSLPGIARLVAEFLNRLDLHDVTLVGNDTGGAWSSCSYARGPGA
jgi:pimeloyl-ACP methyl ester carboxylesterase